LDLGFTAMKRRFKLVVNIKIRLAFQFMLVVAGILLFFAVLVYYFTYTTHREKFRTSLLNRALNTAIITINRHDVDTALLKKIHESTFSNQDQEIILTDSNLDILYSYNSKLLTEIILHSTAMPSNYSFFAIEGKDGICYKFHYRNKAAYVFVLAFDQARANYIAELRQILFWAILFSIWLSVLTSYLLSGRAFKPVAEIIENVKEINSSSLSRRLDEGKGKDELEQLAMTFNEMLANLEVAFRNQEDFISNASHELRTPLSVMIAESEYFLNKEHSPDDYKKHISGIISDIREINTQLNSLLQLARVNKDNSIQFTSVRLDEIIYDAVRKVKNKYAGRKIITKIQFPENENDLIVSGNSGILLIGFINIIENACKFSNDDVNVELILLDNKIKVVVSDIGIGIPSDELDIIYRPFSRGSNAKFKSGFGIGLSLVVKILELHNVKFDVYSTENKGTRFELLFNRLD
jgi:two-component system, OmpR family, sensor histidine kinase ArlS